jgi:hypothetical protein
MTLLATAGDLRNQKTSKKLWRNQAYIHSKKTNDEISRDARKDYALR